ncbi:hypothetical protein M378DRAFT_164224 [Amanita muscaria Koide BX008]|uniref:Uncharacterized protein n=1 Tax=Amanita muscaria (strain Koide BX008) TaxID=946122 RepID=A0A0C2WQ26_AMAMK|nr:hypothetical protein M378DRAFT_164224 [Amanita muscaria Koide BX008]
MGLLNEGTALSWEETKAQTKSQESREAIQNKFLGTWPGSAQSRSNSGHGYADALIESVIVLEALVSCKCHGGFFEKGTFVSFKCPRSLVIMVVLWCARRCRLCTGTIITLT